MILLICALYFTRTESAPEVATGAGSAKVELLNWVNNQIQGYDGVPSVENFTKSFSDGRVLLALCDSMAPGTLDMSIVGDSISNVRTAIETSYHEFGIPALLDAEDVV